MCRIIVSVIFILSGAFQWQQLMETSKLPSFPDEPTDNDKTCGTTRQKNVVAKLSVNNEQVSGLLKALTTYFWFSRDSFVALL